MLWLELINHFIFSNRLDMTTVIVGIMTHLWFHQVSDILIISVVGGWMYVQT